MKLVVANEITELFPDLRIAYVVVTGIDNRGVSEELQAQKKAAAEAMFSDWSNETLTATEEIQAWRNAYKAFGQKPKRSRPTAEAFLRRLIRGDDFPTISKAVDSYLLAETEFRLPVGGYDLDRIAGDIRLYRSAGGEAFTPIGGDDEQTSDGEIVYADESRVLTRKWNYRDCDHTKITEQSTSIGLFTEAPYESVTTKNLAGCIERIATYVTAHCGGNAEIGICNAADSGETTLPL